MYLFIDYFVYDFLSKNGWHKDRYTQTVGKSFWGMLFYEQY